MVFKKPKNLNLLLKIFILKTACFCCFSFVVTGKILKLYSYSKKKFQISIENFYYYGLTKDYIPIYIIIKRLLPALYYRKTKLYAITTTVFT